MTTKLKSIADVVGFLKEKVERRDGLLSELDKCREDDILPHFLRRCLIDLGVAAFQASEAERFLVFAAMERRPDGKDYPDAAKLADISSEVTDYVVNRARSQFSDVGRSSHAATNLSMDAVREFYQEFHVRLTYGH